MNIPATGLLIATAMVPLLAFIGVLFATIVGQRRLNVIIACLGFAGGTACGTILAALLANASDADSSMIQVYLWTWISFSLPQSPSIMFGLEGTVIKAGVIGFFGILALIAVWNINSRTKEPLSDDALLATSLLYAATTIFALTPNPVQAILGWCAASLSAVILMRLSHPQSQAVQSNTQFNTPRTAARQTSDIAEGNLDRRLQILGSAVAFLERIYVSHIWCGVTKAFPNWIAEQVEDSRIDRSSTLQRLFTVTGAAAILLTWLL